MPLDATQRSVLHALLGMQRRSWEQGMLGHALLDLEQWELAEVVARDAVAHQDAQGRLGATGETGIVNSGALVEVVAWASIREPALRSAVGRQLGWLLQGAPRAADGTLLHLEGSREVWADSVYMMLPALVLANEEEAALVQFRGHRQRLFDARSGLWSARFSEDEGRVIRPQHWGTGNGWVAAGIARAIHLGLRSAELADHGQTVIDAVMATRRSDGSFGNVVDEPHSFSENTVGMMLAYAMLQGAEDGWLEPQYAERGHDLVTHARTLVDDHGFVQQVCGAPGFEEPGTSAGAQAFFLLATSFAARSS